MSANCKRTARSRTSGLTIRTLTGLADMLDQAHEDEIGILAAEIRALVKGWRISPELEKQLDEEARSLGMILPAKPSNVVQFSILRKSLTQG